MLGPADEPVTPALLYAMRTGAALMVGWTCLLLWAAARPAERRAVMLFTVVPVIAGLVLAELLAMDAGFLDFTRIGPLLALQTVLSALGLLAYRRVRPGARQP